MSDKITNENKQNIMMGDKGKTAHLSPYSSFYGSSSVSPISSIDSNQPLTSTFPSQQSINTLN